MRSIHALLILFLTLIALPSIDGADYFWIGDSGNWSDISHWATESGGSVTHIQTPTAEDNVFFDANSFSAPNQTVVINSGVAFTRNIDFTDVSFAPTFIGDESVNLSVFGSLLLSTDMIFDFRGNLFFSSDMTGNTIDFNGHNVGTNASFNGTGSWTVINDFIVASTINIESGEILFRDNQVQCEYLYSRSTSTRDIEFENSSIAISGITVAPQDLGREINIYTARFNTSNLTWTARNSTIEISSNNAVIVLEGSGSIDFGRLTTVNSDGDFAIYSLDDQTTVSFSDELALTKNSLLDIAFDAGSLALTAGYRYQFASNKSVSLGSLDAVGSCTSSILISATTSGVSSNWTLAQATVADYLTLSDIQVTTSNATANNSIDQGNNIGWTINEKIVEDLYWIGGSGNWSDVNHWSTTSGGAASGCLPTAADNVFFDANSFTTANQSVIIDIPNALCRSMSWQGVTNNPALRGSELNNILIHGSLTFDPNMNHEFLGDYYFVGDQLNNTIITAGQSFNKTVYFDHVTGGWIFEDDFDALFSIEFANGVLNTNDQTVRTFRFRSDYSTQRMLSLGASNIMIQNRLGSNAHTWLRSDNLTLDAGTSTIFFEANNVECLTEGNESLRYHNVFFSFPSSTIRTLSPVDVTQSFNKVTFLNNGQITGKNEMDSLFLKSGSAYDIEREREQDIGILLWDDICDGLVTIRSFGQGTTLRLATAQELVGFSLFKIKFDNDPPILATSSVDAGSNEGVVFESGSGRDLYWIGGSGEWRDTANWSTTSGGPGGACIPTILDNVFFDENSFTDPNSFIQNFDQSRGFCRNFTFTATGQTGALNIPTINISGDLNLETRWSLPNVSMAGELGSQTIRTSGTQIFYLDIRGRADVTQLDDLYVIERMSFYDNPTYKSNGHSISVKDFSIINDGDLSPSIDLSDTKVTIRGLFRSNIYPLSISGESSTINNLTSSTFDFISATPAASISSNNELGHLLFSASDGNALIEIYGYESNLQSLRFRGNSTVSGNIGMNTDTLLLSPGKTYTFESNISYTVNNMLQARGNNCLPISWQSSQSGEDILLTMPADIPTLDIDFVEMNGIAAVCCNTYFAGNNSTDIGNTNDNWTFGTPDDNPTNEGFLGPDIIICDDDELTLMPFDANEINSIVWSNGSSDLAQTINDNITISALATFTNDCQIRDTVDIRFESSFAVDLGVDTTVCAGSSLVLNPNIAGAQYSWNDNSNQPTLLIEDQGVYTVTVDLGSCSAMDSIEVTYEDAPISQLAESAEACEGDTIALNPMLNGMATVVWPDGSTDMSFEVYSSGEYVVIIENDACTITDTTLVTIHPNPILSALTDSFICDGSMISIGEANQAGFNYSWNTGDNSSLIEVSSPGTYTLSLTDDNGCSVADSMLVSLRPNPSFNLGSDTTICAGETITIGTAMVFEEYIWNSGASQSTITVDQSGSYILSITDNSCSNSDTIEIDIQEYPELALGDDQTLCEGDMVTLTAGGPEAIYIWSDGSTEPSLLISGMGTYSVEANLNGCRSIDSVTFDSAPTPFFDLGTDVDLCEGDSIELLIAAENDWVLSWNTGSTDVALTVNESGEYIAQATLGTCEFSDSIFVDVNLNPIVDLGLDLDKCPEDEVVLNLSNQTGDILWEDGTTDAIRTIQSSGTYSVEIVSEFGCMGGDEIIVTDLACASSFKIYLPNVMSTRSTTGNNRFYPQGNFDQLSYFDMMVFDRWGTILYQSTNELLNDTNSGWDGRVNGDFVNPGVYVYTIEVYNDIGARQVIRGDLTLIH